MTKEFFSWLKAKGIKVVESSSNIKNKQSIKFHKRLGFKKQHIEFGRLL